jgi:hypothetical protein
MLIFGASSLSDFHEFSGISTKNRKIMTFKVPRATYQKTRSEKCWSLVPHLCPISTNFPEFPLKTGKSWHPKYLERHIKRLVVKNADLWCFIFVRFPRIFRNFHKHPENYDIQSVSSDISNDSRCKMLIDGASLSTDFHEFSGISTNFPEFLLPAEKLRNPKCLEWYVKRLVVKNADLWCFIFVRFPRIFRNFH